MSGRENGLTKVKNIIRELEKHDIKLSYTRRVINHTVDSKDTQDTQDNEDNHENQDDHEAQDAQECQV